MKETGELKQYGAGSTLSMAAILSALLLILSSHYPGKAYSQPPCEQAKQRIYLITDTKAQQMVDSLRTLLDLAVFVRDCKSDISLDLELWLLNNEVFALDGLERYEEAMVRVDSFFDVFFDEASDYHRARFYNWRLHLNALSGNTIAMVRDYAQAQKYAGALDSLHRTHFYINGAYAYMRIREYEASLRLMNEARMLIETATSYEDSLTLAQITHVRAEAQLHLGTRLDQVKEDFRAAASLYEALGDMSKVPAIITMLGETYAAAGDTSRALSEVERGVLLARQSGSVRNEIYALFRQGQLQRRRGDLEAAEQSLVQALDGAENVQEFYLEIAYELAMLYEAQHKMRRATSYYQAVIEAPKPADFVAALEAERKKQEAQMRLLLIDTNRHQTYFYLTLAGLLLVLIAIGGMVFFFRQRIPSIIEKKSKGVYIPRRIDTGLTLGELEAYFQEAVESKLFGRRMARIFAALFDPDLVVPYIEDDHLVRQIEEDNIASNAALFQCAAAVDMVLNKQTFQGKPENTMRSYMSTEFARRTWPWPAHPVIWKRFFLKQYAEELLKLNESE